MLFVWAWFREHRFCACVTLCVHLTGCSLVNVLIRTLETCGVCTCVMCVCSVRVCICACMMCEHNITVCKCGCVYVCVYVGALCAC